MNERVDTEENTRLMPPLNHKLYARQDGNINPSCQRNISRTITSDYRSPTPYSPNRKKKIPAEQPNIRPPTNIISSIQSEKMSTEASKERHLIRGRLDQVSSQPTTK